ncbi:hypothetical protein ACRAWF_18975 [Streptomyces sp. L7]
MAGAPSLTTAVPRTEVPVPPATGTTPLVELRNAVKEFRLPWRQRRVPDSACRRRREPHPPPRQNPRPGGRIRLGRSTTARLVLRLTDASAGHIPVRRHRRRHRPGPLGRGSCADAPNSSTKNPYASLDPASPSAR